MDFKVLLQRARQIRRKYSEFETKKYGKPWNKAQIMQGLVGDIGDLMKLVMVKEGVREIQDVDVRLKHELADCLWAVMILADEYGVDLEKSFLETMAELEKKF
ncbi:MAG: MazG nucleotide pyrophosphohydrolase [Candidatus Gottesmanbacteria bacterium GW2011_GWB1_43_11]|uniref:MazG nucleotide pyrophosphohydrolase n=1 Tax=Candidatus Gottesmanbacteria bacterium GW2011_GWB1_43_11 TaxID=1618446 RepID=A0A0G1CPU4_9BACT|nr:MAG: MazG nucleotide pyrophosphohydrolase [Candidatus Gottesmanbacteria bacterium GW2011_GWA2_42_16]KKS56300.1 MAG: MazG nucleotide pyrophosphohydrolase [Candidatus Gottesmanbacteria bacterium GW2011_GWA1_42_26]KKS82308.1 MAG: MazG nucleotide pyrophosphohydrolase [Candidatus Gottesmanbacteria bacterium GW2011_GWC1_43_10]KKS87502.1 MAG: MazG nucleotide pyrophosphohydrolase [Candidatus Gottesmanbacteria bacterium GW2011_GWB1_43_11]OGG10320.1 MAG: hypothetical protein A2699_00730 [Candidatus Go